MAGERLKAGALAAVAVCLIAHAVGVLSIASLDRPVIWPLHNDTVHRPGPAADFFAVYHAGVNAERGVSPYAEEGDGRTPYFFPFRYLPVVAQVGRLFAAMPPAAAFRLWIAVLEGLLASLVVVLWRRAGGWRRTLAVCLLLVSSPYFLELYMGQFTFAATVLLALGLLTTGCWFYVGAALLKTFPLAAGVAFLRTTRWKCLAATAAVLLLVSVPYFASHPGAWSAFYEANFDVGLGAKGGLHSGNYGFAYLLHSALGDLGVIVHWPSFARGLHLLVLAATAAAVLLSRDTRVVLGASAMALAHFVGYAHVWEHHMSGVLVIGLMLLVSLEKERRFTAVCAVCSIALALPTPFGLFDTAKDPRIWDPATAWPLYKLYLTLTPKAIPTVALYAACVLTLCRAGFRSPARLLRKERTHVRRRARARR